MVQKVAVRSRLGFARRRLEKSSCQPKSKWIPFPNYIIIKLRKERDGLRLCPRYSGTLTSTSPTAIRLWETFTYLLTLSLIAFK